MRGCRPSHHHQTPDRPAIRSSAGASDAPVRAGSKRLRGAKLALDVKGARCAQFGDGGVSVADGVDGRVDVAGEGEVARPAEMTLDRARENGKAHPRAGEGRVVTHRRSWGGRSSGHLSSDQATSSRCDGLRIAGTGPCRVYP
jgi:hypothetical protein